MSVGSNASRMNLLELFVDCKKAARAKKEFLLRKIIDSSALKADASFDSRAPNFAGSDSLLLSDSPSASALVIKRLQFV